MIFCFKTKVIPHAHGINVLLILLGALLCTAVLGCSNDAEVVDETLVAFQEEIDRASSALFPKIPILSCSYPPCVQAWYVPPQWSDKERAAFAETTIKASEPDITQLILWDIPINFELGYLLPLVINGPSTSIKKHILEIYEYDESTEVWIIAKGED